MKIEVDVTFDVMGIGVQLTAAGEAGAGYKAPSYVWFCGAHLCSRFFFPIRLPRVVVLHARAGKRLIYLDLYIGLGV